MLVDTILEKKGGDVLLLDVQDQIIFADYFLLCNGESDRQLKALVNGIVEDAKAEARQSPLGIEGSPDDGWMLVDFGDVIVHVFAPDKRDYYNLEELWRDARVVLRMQ